jgi:multidrug transporter EmrE-like cation transporter
VKNYLLIFPIALLVSYSQLIVKWRTNGEVDASSFGLLERLWRFLLDPVILSAYGAALLASFAWLYVVTRLPLTVAFPVYIGVTFVMVLLGGWLLLGESLSASKLVAVTLITAGIVVGLSSDA